MVFDEELVASGPASHDVFAGTATKRVSTGTAVEEIESWATA
jgi:hypothetical protein